MLDVGNREQIKTPYDGRKADVFGAGAILLEMMLGHQSFNTTWLEQYRDAYSENNSEQLTKRLILTRFVRNEKHAKHRIPNMNCRSRVVQRTTPMFLVQILLFIHLLR